MNPTQAPSAPQTLSLEQAIALGIEHQKAGRLPQAEDLYSKILKVDPNYYAALHLLGVVAHQVGKNEIAVELIEKALAIQPRFAEACNNLGLALQGLGRGDEAVASFRKALALKPDYQTAQMNLDKAVANPPPLVATARVRNAAVAGHFYSGDAAELRADVERMLAQAANANDKRSAMQTPKALIAPHAGYIYSGANAARAYALLQPMAAVIKRVILLGPCHTAPLKGMALSGADRFRTPLGDVPVDKAAAARVAGLAGVGVVDTVHEKEHSLEVHLPFLQVVLDDFSVLPLVVGDTTTSDVADVIDAVWGGPETLIVISTDLSHYLDYETARQRDAATCRAIERLDSQAISSGDACGRFPVGGFLDLAKRRHMTIQTLHICNSGDTAGTKDRVVGYGAWMCLEKTAEPPPQGPSDTHSPAGEPARGETFTSVTRALLDVYGWTLLKIAARSIEYGLNNQCPLPTTVRGYPDLLTATGACFVTLNRGGRLRGCIGSPEAHRPLVLDVAENAFKSAFKDTRFRPLAATEMPGLALSISVLGRQGKITFTDEADFLASLRPGIDGLVIEDNNRRALFLPMVWAQIADRKSFVEHLKVKAGLPADHWSPTFKAWRFDAEELAVADLEDPNSIWDHAAISNP